MADVLRLYGERPSYSSSKNAASRALIAVAGSVPVRRLAAAHVIEACESVRSQGHLPSTVNVYLSAMRQCLLMLWTDHGAKKLDDEVPQVAAIRPRNVVARRDEIDAVFALADPPVKLFILLCSDLAIRSGTAMRIAPPMFDAESCILRFRSKKNSTVTVPVTAEIAELFAQCNLGRDTPFITQLCEGRRRGRPRGEVMLAVSFRARFRALCKQAGIERRITPHDMRRRAAVEMYKYTHNIRKVQRLLGHASLGSTVWYLDNELEPLDTETLEAVKRPFIVRRKEKSA